MISDTKKRLEVPSECSTEEFTRLTELARRLLSWPNRDKKPAGKKPKTAASGSKTD